MSSSVVPLDARLSEGCVADDEHALKDARDVGQAATLMYALQWTGTTQILCGNYAAASALFDELAALVEEKGAAMWEPIGMCIKGFYWS